MHFFIRIHPYQYHTDKDRKQQLFVTTWRVAPQAVLSIGFARQEYWSGCHALLQGILSLSIVSYGYKYGLLLLC